MTATGPGADRQVLGMLTHIAVLLSVDLNIIARTMPDPAAPVKFTAAF